MAVCEPGFKLDILPWSGSEVGIQCGGKSLQMHLVDFKNRLQNDEESASIQPRMSRPQFALPSRLTREAAPRT